MIITYNDQATAFVADKNETEILIFALRSFANQRLRQPDLSAPAEQKQLHTTELESFMKDKRTAMKLIDELESTLTTN